MARRKRILGAVIAIVAILAAAVLLGRDWQAVALDWSARAGRAVGVKIAIDGKTRLALLPPAITIEQVRIGQGDGDTLASIGRLSLLVSPWSLLQAAPQITGIALDRVHVGPLTLDAVEARFSPDHIDGFSKIGGHAVTFAGSIDRDAGQAASFRLTIPTLGTALRFDGSWENNAESPILSGHASLNSGNLAALLPTLSLPPGQSVRAEADLDAGDGQVSVVNLNIDANGSRASGSLTALAGSPALIEADLDIDRLDLDAWHGGKSAALPALLPAALTPPAEAPVRAVADSPPAASPEFRLPRLPDDLFANLRLTVGAVIWRGQTVHNLDLQAGLDQGAVVLRHAQAEIGDDLRLNADGVWESDQFKGRLRVNGPGLSGRADVLALPPRLELTDLRVNRDGIFAQGRLTAEWDNAITTTWAGQIGSWRDTALTARLFPTAASVEASDLALRIDSLALRGQVNADFSGPRPRVDAALRGDDLNLAALPSNPFAQAAAPAKTFGKTGARSRNSTATAKTSGKTGPKSSSPFSTTALDWSGLNSFDGIVTLAATSLTGGFGRLEQPTLTVALNNGTAKLENLRGDFLGGSIAAQGGASGGAVPSLRLDATVSNLDLAQLKPGLAGLSLDRGRLNASIRLHTFGKSSRDMATNTQGEGHVEGGAGSVDGIDLAAIDGQMGHLGNIGNVLALVQTGMKGGRTPYSHLSGRVTIKDGIVHSPDLTLVATGGTLRSDLSLDLAEWTTETTISLALASLPSTPLNLRLSGPANNPRKVVDANALQKALVQSGLGRALGKSDAQADESGKKPGGRKILKDLFRAFGGGG